MIRDAITTFGRNYLADRAAQHPAARDLLERRAPRLRDNQGGHKGRPYTNLNLPDDLFDIVNRLDGSTLCIQGPPGSGKTFCAASVIVRLVSEGRRVGVTSNSHKAIDNLLAAVADESRRSGKPVNIVHAGGEGDDQRIRTCESKELAGEIAQGGVVAGGTAWAFCRPELADTLDYLFVDEAGQVALANAVAMGLSARNIVLIGDQMQLSQPAQGTHPEQSGLSCFHYYLHGYSTVPPEQGVLLPTTWRLHPEICSFISDTAYDGRLKPEEHTAQRCLVVPEDATLLRRGTGIVMSDVEHDGNTNESEEEARRIVELVAELKRCVVNDETGPRPFNEAEDLLIVAPFNAQVRLLKEKLGPGIRIASVDKFQGQEATVVIVSMCASALDDAPRGAGFLLSPNRLNVAISRAKCLAIVVSSPKLIRVRPKSVREMELLNLFCRLRFYARDLVANAKAGAIAPAFGG